MFRPLIICALLLTGLQAGAAIEATTNEGKKVLLKDDGTWEYQKTEEQPQTAMLTVELYKNIPNGCRLGARLTNNLNAQIRTLVLRFTAIKNKDIAFETVSRGYTYIKPTTSQYQQVRFRGISCEDISKIRVEGARNCHVGELTKYSDGAKGCLSLVTIVPSDRVKIYK